MSANYRVGGPRNLWLCSRQLARPATFQRHSSRAPRAQQGAGCPRTQRSIEATPTPPADAPERCTPHLYRSSLEAPAASSKAFDTVGGLFWRLSSRRSTHAVRPARPGIRSTQSPRPPVNPPPPPAWRVCARRCAELCRPSSDDHEHDEEDELAHAAAQVVRGEERLEEAACRAERGGRRLTGARGARGAGACWRACRGEGASPGGGMRAARPRRSRTHAGPGAGLA